MPPSKKVTTQSEFTQSLTDRIRQAARRPSLNGYREEPKQKLFHASKAKGRLYIGGNRSGKTVGGGVEMVRAATGKDPHSKFPPPPLRLRSVAVDFLQGVNKIVLPEIARWMPPSELINGSWEQSYSKENKTLTLENGSFIEFMSYEQELEKFAGTSRHAVWFDEEPPEDIFTENKARLIDTGGCWWITMTPVEGMTWVYDDIYVAAKFDKNLEVIEVDMTENSHLSETEIDLFLSGLSKDEQVARKQGKFVQIGGLIYKDFSERHLIDPIKPPVGQLWIAGMDHGYTNPTCWLWAWIDADDRYFIFDEYYQDQKIIEEHAKTVLRIDAEHKRIPDLRVGDPSIRNTDPITRTSVLLEYGKYEIHIMLGNNDQKAGINRVKTLLEQNKLFIGRNCVNLIREMQRLRWATFANKKINRDKNKKEEQHKKDDHACDALRYLVTAPIPREISKHRDSVLNEMVAETEVGGYNIDRELERTGARRVVDEHLGDEW